MNALLVVDGVNEAADVGKRHFKRRVFVEINLLFFDGEHETFGIAILPGLAFVGHADLDIEAGQGIGVSWG